MSTSWVVITGEPGGIPVDLFVAITEGVSARYPHAKVGGDGSGGWKITVDTEDYVPADEDL